MLTFIYRFTDTDPFCLMKLDFPFDLPVGTSGSLTSYNRIPKLLHLDWHYHLDQNHSAEEGSYTFRVPSAICCQTKKCAIHYMVSRCRVDYSAAWSWNVLLEVFQLPSFQSADCHFINRHKCRPLFLSAYHLRGVDSWWSTAPRCWISNIEQYGTGPSPIQINRSVFTVSFTQEGKIEMVVFKLQLSQTCFWCALPAAIWETLQPIEVP